MHDLCDHMQDLILRVGDGSVQVPTRALEEEAVRPPQISPSCSMLAVQTTDRCAQNHTPHETRQGP